MLATDVLGGAPQLLQLIVLALGGALFVANVAALVKPPTRPKAGTLARAPKARTLTMAGIGLLVSVWALASLLAG